MSILGDCLDQLKNLDDNSIDAIVTDPPYGLSFMGKKWDYDVPSVEIWRECLRVLKPGGHLLSFGGTRTYHRLVVNIEDAGFEIRDQIQWIYGSGFPKSHNIKKGEFKGWGTALKPANEPICVARKPLEGTVAQNIEKWGVGGLNIDESRIEGKPRTTHAVGNVVTVEAASGHMKGKKPHGPQPAPQGRWPANIIFDEAAAEMLDEQTQHLHASGNKKKGTAAKETSMFGIGEGGFGQSTDYGDSGGASRFFYVAKASKKERNAGLEGHERILQECKSKDEAMAAAQLLRRVISASMVKWSTDESGVRISATFPKECRSTIETESRAIIESQTLNSLIHSLTNANTVDAKSETANGLNLVDGVANTKQWLLSITSGSTALALGASHAASAMLQRINESAVSQLNNFHATVKPIKLMEYLIKLVTPKGGVVLDPFMGSGSTGVAAVGLGYTFVGIEMSQEYIQIAEKRINNADE